MAVTRSILPKRIEELVSGGELVLFTKAFPVVTFHDKAATAFAWLAFALSAARTVMFFATGRGQRWQHRFEFVLASQVAAGVAFWFLGHTTSLLVMVLASTVVGFSAGWCYFVSLYCSVAKPDRRHARTAIHESSVGIGSFIGAMGFGYLAGRYGAAWPFLHAGYAIAALLIVQIALLKLGHRKHHALP